MRPATVLAVQRQAAVRSSCWRFFGCLVAAGALLVSACSGDDGDGGAGSAGSAPTDSAPASADAGAFEPQVGELPDAARRIMTEDPYESARWSYSVEPVDGDDPVLERDSDLITAMGSNTKLYTVGSWVESYGIDHTFTTPVHEVDDALVLVASGDLTMGGRNAESGTLGYSIPPQTDAGGLPGAEPAPGDPLTGLDDLAAQVAASGITSAEQVVIDDRLFEQWYAHDEVISPIVINDNLLAVQTRPTTSGEPADLTIIPDTEAFEIVNQVQTVDSDGDTQVDIVAAEQTVAGDPIGRTLEVQGTIAEGADATLNVFQVQDPANFGRTLFVEALERAGVSVAADPVEPNDTSGLPTDYPDGSEVATFASPTVGETATLIWKISHNYGANLAVCLLAVQGGSTDCTDGFAPVRDNIGALDIGDDEVWILDGSGESFSSTTPRAMVTWLRWLHGLSWGDQLPDMLPILGVDGSLGLTQQDTEATGKVQGKSGTWAGLDPGTGKLLTPDQSVAGLMEAADGTVYLFALYQAGSTFDLDGGVIKGTNDVNDVAAAFQESL